MGMVVGYRSAADAEGAAASNSRCDVLRRTRDRERLWPPGPTSIPQETGMNRRVSPCGLRGGIGCHQGALWTPLSGRMASVMRCQVSQRWTSGRLSQMRLHPVSQACGHDLRPASSGCKVYGYASIDSHPPAHVVLVLVWLLVHTFPGGFEVCGWLLPARLSGLSCIASCSRPGTAPCVRAALPASGLWADAPFCVCNYVSK